MSTFDSKVFMTGSRSDQTLTNQLRTNCSFLKTTKRKYNKNKTNNVEQCIYCKKVDSHEHFMLDCVCFTTERTKLFKTFIEVTNTTKESFTVCNILDGSYFPFDIKCRVEEAL